MNKKIMTKLGFGERAKRISEDKCATCGKDIPPEYEFKDAISVREWRISGICQECQDSVLEGPEELE